jgi:hypothetical protein
MATAGYDTGIEQVIGAAKGSVLSLRVTHMGPEHLDFAGLIRARALGEATPDAVVLHDNQPLMYVLDYRQRALPTPENVQHLIQLMAMRSDAPYVAVLRPGAVEVFSVSDGQDAPDSILREDTAGTATVMARLIANVAPGKSTRTTHELMLELLNAATDHLMSTQAIPGLEALAMVGRALFVRFLGDRKILPAAKPFLGVHLLRDCFATAEAAAATCAWLDETFNGDLLPLPDHGSAAYFAPFERYAEASPLSALTAIIRGEKPLGDGAYQGRFSWGDLHFSYIPVSLLSQVYEQYVHRFEVRRAKKDSVYYTPRHIAEYMVDHSFSMLGSDAHTARVLDVTSGGGVFLLAAFRRLVRAHWAFTGKQPVTRDIRHILNHQLVGMDINPAARRLSALALYLTALELDPRTEKLKNLRFDALDGNVLIAAEYWLDPATGTHPGSLAAEAVEKYGAQFDLVVGNPPWTAGSTKSEKRAFEHAMSQSMAKRGITFTGNPDGVPDLPFLWRATEMAKPNAVIALALHGRLLLKTSPQGHAARRQIFEGMDVSYVLNGMELRNTKVWPKIAAHFCLLFAHNRSARPTSTFYAVTPVEDRGLNRAGRVRIDSRDAWTSDPGMVERSPALFKTLAKGNALDVELIDQVQSRGYSTLKALLEQEGLPFKKGYQTQMTGSTQKAGFLRGMRMMPKAPDADWPVVPVSTLERFQDRIVHRKRRAANYRAPLVLLRESPSSKPGRQLAMLALEDVAYSESYIGISCVNASNPLLTAIYLHTLLNSRFFLYFQLMTSAKFGCERSAVQKSDVDEFPVPQLQSLLVAPGGPIGPRGRRAAERQVRLRNNLMQIESVLLAAVEQGSDPIESTATLREAFVSDLYQLTPADLQLIDDRLAMGLPFKEVTTRAMRPVTNAQAQAYAAQLAEVLAPFAEQPVTVKPFTQDESAPWRFLQVAAQESARLPAASQLLAAIAGGDLLDCTLVELPQAGSLLVGILNQRRFWTATAARTFALDLIKRQHPVLSAAS